jgi:nucleotide-binding universal stress UspA family protein
MTILDTVEELDTDLICIASHGISGVTRMLVGSVTARVVRRAECPVLTLRVDPEARDGEKEAGEASEQAGSEA